MTCEKHPSNPVAKICKHPECSNQPPFCSVCGVEHSFIHINFLEDIETLMNPKKLNTVKELSTILRMRLEQESKENNRVSGSNTVISEFRNAVQQNRAKLKQCLIHKIISKKDDELRLEVKMINDRITRKFVLLAETKGDDPYLARDYLLTYAHGTARLNEIADMIKNQTAITKTSNLATKYLLGVQEIYDGITKYTRPIIGDIPQTSRKSNSRIKRLFTRSNNIEIKNEHVSRMGDSSNFADNEYDCKYSESTPRRSTSQKHGRSFLTSEKGSKPYKKLKRNSELSRAGTSTGEMDANCKISGKLPSILATL